MHEDYIFYDEPWEAVIKSIKIIIGHRLKLRVAS